MSTLFQLQGEALEINNFLEEYATEHDGDITDIGDRFWEWLEKNKADIESKLEAYVAVIEAKQYDSSIRKDKAKSISALAKFDDNAVERLKSTLRDFMDSIGKTKIDLPTCKVSTQANGGVAPMDIDDKIAPKLLPAEVIQTGSPYIIKTVTYSYDMKAVREAAELDNIKIAKANEAALVEYEAGLDNSAHADPVDPFVPIGRSNLALKVPWAEVKPRGRQLRIK